MGYMKEVHMDYEQCFDLIGELSNVLLNNKIKSPLILRTLERLRIELAQCMERSDVKAPAIVLKRINNIFEKISNADNVEDTTFISNIHMQLHACLRLLKELNSTRSIVLNSEKFYTDLINSSTNKINELSQEIEKLREEKSTLTVNKKVLAEKEDELKKLTLIVEEYRNRENELKLRDDAIANWKTKIQASFKELDTHITPIKKEHKRLCELFWIYNILSLGVIILLIVLEVIICCKLCKFDGIPPFKDYISLIVPIPIAIGLLWGFITQANRAQRQRVVLSKFIHDIKYTEGILLSINNLATDVSDSAQRINNALDKLLDKHLSCNLDYIKENSLKEEEKKDTIPYDLLINIIKELKKQV